MRAGEAITRLLSRYDVTHVFGIPGTHTLELYRGLADNRYGVQHVLAHHEQGAGFMADGYARTTGRPGVCFVITGAGVTNIATPMAEAYADSVPMLVVSPVNQPDGGGYNRGRLHEITDQAAVTAPLTAFSATVHDVDEIPELIARAFMVFASERPRPVHISVPLPLLLEELTVPWEPRGIPSVPVVSDLELERAGQAVAAAEWPVIIAGGGVRFSPGPVVALAEAIGCPVITTVAGRGVIAGSHVLCPGAQLRAGPVQRVLQESDLVILLGTALSQTDHWNDDLPLPDKQIRVNVDGENLIAPGEVVALRGDASDAAARLGRIVSGAKRDVRMRHSVARCKSLRGELSQSMTVKEQNHWQILEHVQRTLPQNAMIFSDMTQIAYTAVDYMPLEQPNSWHHPTGYGTLGYALPAAIGGAIAEPDRPVLVVVGDAGLQYTMQELPLAAELGLNIKILLWNNDTLEQIRDDMVAAGIAPTAVVQRNPEFSLLAQACGWEYGRVDRLENLEVSLARAFTHQGPYLLQINEKNIFPGLAR